MQKNGSATFESKIDSLKDSVRNLADAGKERVGHLKDRAIGAKDSVVESGGAAVQRVGALIKEHPFAALGIAFAVGYVAVRMMRK